MGDSSKLFRVVNSLSREPLKTAPPEHEDPTKLANEFGTSLPKKIETIKENLYKLQVQEPRLASVTTKENLESLSALSIEEVCKIVRESSNTSCWLDPVPTWLVKSCLDVSLHLDYCNVLPFGLPKYQLDRLQKVQDTAARVIFQMPKFHHITPALIDLHWLPVTFRVQFKLLLFVYKSLENQSRLYIKDLLSLKPAANYALRSSAQSLLFFPKVSCSTIGDRAFAHAAPVLFNSLPLTIRTSRSLAILKKNLKTILFRKAFSLLK